MEQSYRGVNKVDLNTVLNALYLTSVKTHAQEEDIAWLIGSLHHSPFPVLILGLIELP